MTGPTTVEDLAALLEHAGRAHHQAFIEEDGEDPEWPLWYAEFLESRMTEVLGKELTRSRLVQCLLNAEEEHVSRGSAGPWPEFYARYILGLSEDAIGLPPEPGEA